MAKHDMLIKVEGLDRLEDLVIRLEAACRRLEAAGVPSDQLPAILMPVEGVSPYSPCNCVGVCTGHAIGTAE